MEKKPQIQLISTCLCVLQMEDRDKKNLHRKDMVYTLNFLSASHSIRQNPSDQNKRKGKEREQKKVLILFSKCLSHPFLLVLLPPTGRDQPSCLNDSDSPTCVPVYSCLHHVCPEHHRTFGFSGYHFHHTCLLLQSTK